MVRWVMVYYFTPLIYEYKNDIKTELERKYKT
jgi:hypothetical protein